MNTDFDQACAALEAAKIAENAAKQARIDAEAAVLAHATARDEGSTTVRGQRYKAVVTYGVNRTVDAAALSAIAGTIPAALLLQAIEYKPSLRVVGLKYLRGNEPDVYAVLAQAITATPAKPSVRLEAIELREVA